MPERQVDVAILAFPEATASVVYGFHDLFHGVGRDWGLIVDGKPGSSPMTARVVATQPEPFIAANGVRIQPDGPLDFVRTPDVVEPGMLDGGSRRRSRCFSAVRRALETNRTSSRSEATEPASARNVGRKSVDRARGDPQ